MTLCAPDPYVGGSIRDTTAPDVVDSFVVESLYPGGVHADTRTVHTVARRRKRVYRIEERVREKYRVCEYRVFRKENHIYS
jgi:hypothetical protein